MHSLTRLTSLLLLPLAILTGCADDAPVEPAAAVQWTKPGLGSSFTYSGFRTDSTGREMPGTTDSYTDSVIAVDVAARGRTGLVGFTYMGFFQVLFDYRANGDLAIALEDPDGVESPWSVFPVGSKGTVTQDAWSFSAGDSSTGITVWSTPYTTYTHMGTEQTVTPAGTFATHRILKRSFDTTHAGEPYILNDTAWYAPSIGTYVRQSRPADMVRFETGVRAELSSYTLK